MREKKNKKIQDIVELICLSILRPDQIDSMLIHFILTLGDTVGCEIETEKLIAKVKKKLFSEDFLKNYTQSFDQIFSHSEIKLLIKYYKSEACQKMHGAAPKIITPLYSAIQHLVFTIASPVCFASKRSHLQESL